MICDANNLARFLNEKGKLSVLVQNFMSNRPVFLDFLSHKSVHTNLCTQICDYCSDVNLRVRN